ncbi:hypothetical protein KC345_g1915 [Hortaea werneckii]|nr:hypothetical protein KC345_g1915 [Hortaea werneckii]
MGASGSKASRAAGSAARQYPNRPAPAPPSAQSATNAPPQPPPALNHEPGPTVKPQARATGSRDEAINLDASDPDFAQSLRSIGPVQPNPTLSPTSTFPNPGNPNKNLTQAPRPLGPKPRENPTLVALDSRAKLQEAADAEFQMAGKRGHEGRQFLDVYMIRQILIERDVQGRSAEEIERKMGLKKGVVERLGGKGVVQLAQEQGRGQRGVEISSNRVAMAGAAALLRQLLQDQTQILARLDTVDEKLENLAAGQDQLSASQNQLLMELHETRKAQNDVALKVAAMRTHFHDPAGQRLVDTPELLEMILLQLDECPNEESRMDESDDENDHCDEYTGRLFDPKIHKQVLVCHGLYVKCDEDPEGRPHLALEARADSEGWCHIMFDIEDISNLPVVSESVAMPSTKALLQRLLQTQSQILNRLDTLDERLDNLTASHDQLSDDVCDARKAQHDVAMEVHSLRTHVYNPASARLVNTTELLEMILLEVVDLRSDVVEDPCDEHCNKYHYGRIGWHCGKFDDQAYHRYLDREVAKASEQARRLRTLLLSRRVSRRFRETIDCSSKLQQALFFTPDPPAGATARINWLYLTSQVCHKLVVRGDTNQEGSICVHLVPETSDGA